MALKLRRGPNADRLSIVFEEGELVYVTDTKQLYMGDGTTVGGNVVSGINSVLDDLSPQLGGPLDLNSYDITGQGNLNIRGLITSDFKGSFFGDDSAMLIDGINSKLVFDNNTFEDFPDVDYTTVLAPGDVLRYNSSTQKWENNQITLGSLVDVTYSPSLVEGDILVWDGGSWQTTSGAAGAPQPIAVTGNFKGSVFSDDSTVLVDAVNNRLNLINNSVDDFGDTFFPTPISNGEILRYNAILQSWTNSPPLINTDVVFVDQLTAISGFTGSVYADDSTLLVDATLGKVNISNNGIEELLNVSTNPPTQDDLLQWDGVNWTPVSFGLDDLNDVSTIPATGDVLTWDGGQWIAQGPYDNYLGTISADVQGSIVGVDSTILLDANTKELYIDQINVDGNGIVFKSEVDGTTLVFNVGRKAPAVWAGERENTTTVLANDGNANALFLAGYTDQNGKKVSAVINYYDDLITFGHHPNGFVPGSGPFEPAAAQLVTISSTVGASPKLGIGTKTPSQELDVVGNATVAGFMQVGRYADGTARDAAITAPGEGMIVFNQATQKFQGYVSDTGLAGGGLSNSIAGWVDLY